ncbi:hypothetical protein FKM82_011531 [Ascaphus truei]
MAAPSSSAEQGYIKTVLGHDHFMDLDSSSLALPSEERLTVSAGPKHDVDRSLRIHQQVQLTMARKNNKRYMANGSLLRATSVPDQVHHHQISVEQRGLSSTPSKYHESTKEYKSVRYDNGWGGGNASTSQWKTEQDTTMRRPLMRLEISPERGIETVACEYRSNVGTSPRYQENKGYVVTSPRYARSDITSFNRYGTTNKARQSIAQKFYQVGSNHNSVFMSSLPTSPAGHLYHQSRNSRSMNNLFEKENYQIQPSAVGQVRSMMPPQMNRGSSSRSRWQQSTYRSGATGRESFQSTAVGSGFDSSGKKITMTAGTAAGGGSGIAQDEREGAQWNSQVGNASRTSEVEMTMERAVNMLESDNASSGWVTTAASFIQHECFQKAEARRRVYSLGGIPKLLQLLSNDNEDVQRAACAALRNIVFEDNDNKLEVCEQRGIPSILSLLRDTRDVETKRQIAGLLWNLSSNDQLKGMLIRDALRPLNKSIIIPCSGWSEGDYPKKDILTDSDTFYNATGCLRNMSSAGPEGRKEMRECDGLIDSLVHYVRGSVADYKPDDKSTENCVCILHNLSYQLEAELPSSYTQNIYTQSRDVPQNNRNVGCFGTRSSKIKEQWRDAPLIEEKNSPRGVEWLWHSIVIRMYLSLIAKSTRNYTQEASLGALQNLTAGNGPMPFALAQMVVQKENGLPHIRNMLLSKDPGVKKTAVSLLRNMSRNGSLQNEIAKELLSDLTGQLPNSAPDSNMGNETVASVCYVLSNLISNSSPNARTLLNNGGVQKLSNLSIGDCNLTTKAGKAASVVLYNMWLHQDLHSTYKKALFKKTDFVNIRTSKAYHSLKD